MPKKQVFSSSKLYAATLLGFFFGGIAILFLRQSNFFNTITRQDDGVESIQEKSDNAAETATISENDIHTQAWIYPGETTCGLQRQLEKVSINALKPEYFTIDSDGSFLLLTEADRGCNGFSTENLAFLKKHSEKQYITISGRYDPMVALLSLPADQREAEIKVLVDFVAQNAASGIEIDFEDFGTWSEKDYKNYLNFIRTLGNYLHAADKELLVAGPPIADELEQTYYKWKYADFVSMPVDYVVVMAYDYQADHGVGSPVAPTQWVRQIYEQILNTGLSAEKIIVGIPAYGYSGNQGAFNMELLTYSQALEHPLFSKAVRDESSYEMIAEDGGLVLVYQDRISLQKKRQALLEMNVKGVSVWHLGNNSWF